MSDAPVKNTSFAASFAISWAKIKPAITGCLVLAAAFLIPWQVEPGSAIFQELFFRGSASLSEYLFYYSKNPFYLHLDIQRADPLLFLPSLLIAAFGKNFTFFLLGAASVFLFYRAYDQGVQKEVISSSLVRSFLLTAPFLFGAGGLFFFYLVLLLVLHLQMRGFPALKTNVMLVFSSMVFLPAALPAFFYAGYYGNKGNGGDEAGKNIRATVLRLLPAGMTVLAIYLFWLALVLNNEPFAANENRGYFNALAELFQLPFTLESRRALVTDTGLWSGLLDQLIDRGAAYLTVAIALGWNILDELKSGLFGQQENKQKSKQKRQIFWLAMGAFLAAELFLMRAASLVFLHGALFLSILFAATSAVSGPGALVTAAPSATNVTRTGGDKDKTNQRRNPGAAIGAVVAVVLFAIAGLSQESCRPNPGRGSGGKEDARVWVVSPDDLAYFQVCPVNVEKVHFLDLKIIPYNVEKLTAGLSWPDEEPVFNPRAMEFLAAEKEYAERKTAELSHFSFHFFLKSGIHPAGESKPYRRIRYLWDTFGDQAGGREVGAKDSKNSEPEGGQKYRRSLILR